MIEELVTYINENIPNLETTNFLISRIETEIIYKFYIFV